MKILNVFTISLTAKSFFNGQYRYLSDQGYDIWVVSSSAEPVEFTNANAVTYRQLDIRRRISPLADIKTIVALRSFIRHEKFDAVIGHTPKGAMIAMIASLLASTRTRIYYRHGLIYTTANGIKRVLFKTIERLTALCSTSIVNVSPSLGKLAVIDHLNHNRKQHVIGCGTCGGIDTTEVFNPEKVSEAVITNTRRALGIPSNAFVIGFCGRLCYDKGIVELIEGFKLFQKNHPELDPRLLLVGSYDEREILPQNIKDDIESALSIVTTGGVDQDKLPVYYSLMDVFVFPSHREGFGMTVIEASAMCLPILVSRSHGCVDSIRENITGRYIDLSPESIAASLNEMIDPQLRHRLGNAGRQFVTENFERTKMWPKILNFYKTELSKE